LSYLNEEDSDAFFHQGDAGTYDGGPLSLAPVGLAESSEAHDDRSKLPTAEQVARRVKFKRIVTTVVSTLGIGSVLVFALRVTRQETETAAAILPTIGKEVAPAPRVPAPAAALGDRLAVPVAALAPEHSDTAAPDLEEVERAPAVGSGGGARGPSRSSPARTAATHHTALGHAPRTNPSPVWSPAPGGHTPPTATFPD
jgi:hypothetical protein